MASRGYNDPYFIQYSLSDNTCQLPANQDYRRLPGRSHRRNHLYENVRGRDRGEGESKDSTNDDFVTCHTSTCVTSTLTLRKMSLKSNNTSQMSLNRRNGDRNRDRCHGIVEIVTDVEMAIVPPISSTCSFTCHRHCSHRHVPVTVTILIVFTCHRHCSHRLYLAPSLLSSSCTWHRYRPASSLS